MRDRCHVRNAGDLEPHVVERPHRRFARQGWVEILVESEGDVAGALRWLRRAWRATGAAAPDASC